MKKYIAAFIFILVAATGFYIPAAFGDSGHANSGNGSSMGSHMGYGMMGQGYGNGMGNGMMGHGQGIEPGRWYYGKGSIMTEPGYSNGAGQQNSRQNGQR